MPFILSLSLDYGEEGGDKRSPASWTFKRAQGEMGKWPASARTFIGSWGDGLVADGSDSEIVHSRRDACQFSANRFATPRYYVLNAPSYPFERDRR